MSASSYRPVTFSRLTPRRSRLTLAFIILSAAVLAAACSSSSSSNNGSAGTGGAKEVRIEVVADQSGPYSQLGNGVAAGVQTAAKAINAGGSGLKLNVTTIDSLSTTTGAQAAAQQALAAKPDLVIAGWSGVAMSTTESLFAAAKIPLITTTVIDSLLVPKPASWFFALAPTSAQTATLHVAATKALLGSLQGKKFALDATTNPTAIAEIDAFAKGFEAQGGQVVVANHDAASLASFTSQAANIAAKKPDATLIAEPSQNVEIIAKALVAAGVNAPVITGLGADDTSVFKSLSLPNFYALRTLIEAKPGDMQSVAAQKYGTAQYLGNSYFEQGWIAAYTAELAAAKCAGTCSSFSSAIESLGAVTIPGQETVGPLTFGPDRHDPVTAAELFRWDPTTQSAVPSGGSIDAGNLG